MALFHWTQVRAVSGREQPPGHNLRLFPRLPLCAVVCPHRRKTQRKEMAGPAREDRNFVDVVGRRFAIAD